MPNTDAFPQMRYRWCDLDNVPLQLGRPPQADWTQKRFPDEKGEGVFHIGFMVPGIDALEALGLAAGPGVLTRGRRPDRTGFTRFDTEGEAGPVLLARRSPL